MRKPAKSTELEISLYAVDVVAICMQYGLSLAIVLALFLAEYITVAENTTNKAIAKNATVSNLLNRRSPKCLTNVEAAEDGCSVSGAAKG